MNKRVYGVLGISAIMANWNADFTGYPKMTSDGNIFGSDKALKYPMKKMWDNEGEKVLYIKSYDWETDSKTKEKQMNPRSLGERYIHIFGTDKVEGDTEIVLKNLFQAVDVKNFGATFAEKGNNISITGAVQIGQGFNKYEDSRVEEQQILSPFRDGTKDADNDGEGGKSKQSTLGTKIVSNEAHYVYPFVINPQAYKEYEELGVTQGYTQEDYDKFKRTSMVATTSYATNAKVGCENELAVFIETKPDLYLPNLSEYVTFSKRDGKNQIMLTFDTLLNELQDSILSVEIYYNPYTTELVQNIQKAILYNIFTQKEV